MFIHVWKVDGWSLYIWAKVLIEQYEGGKEEVVASGDGGPKEAR